MPAVRLEPAKRSAYFVLRSISSLASVSGLLTGEKASPLTPIARAAAASQEKTLRLIILHPPGPCRSIFKRRFRCPSPLAQERPRLAPAARRPAPELFPGMPSRNSRPLTRIRSSPICRDRKRPDKEKAQPDSTAPSPDSLCRLSDARISWLGPLPPQWLQRDSRFPSCDNSLSPSRRSSGPPACRPCHGPLPSSSRRR